MKKIFIAACFMTGFATFAPVSYTHLDVYKIQEHIWPKDSAAVSLKLNAMHDGYTKHVDTTQSIFPINKKWNQDWYGPLRIPKKGDVVQLNQETLPEYRWIISEYEHNLSLIHI